MNRLIRDRKIRQRLESGPAPEPPADLLEKIQREIPRHLGEGEDADPARRPSPTWPVRRLLAASLATAITGGALAYLVIDRSPTPDEAPTPASTPAPSEESAAADERAAGPGSSELSKVAQGGPEALQAAAAAQSADRGELEPSAPRTALEGEPEPAPPAAPEPKAIGPVSAAVPEAFERRSAAPAAEPELRSESRAGDRLDGERAPAAAKVVREKSSVDDVESAAPSAPPGGPASENESLRRLQDAGSDAPGATVDPPPAARSFATSAADPRYPPRRRARGESGLDSYALARDALLSERLPPPEAIRAEDFAAAFPDDPGGAGSGGLSRMATELAEILRRSDAARAEDLRSLLGRLGAAVGEAPGDGARELEDLARRALGLIENGEQAPGN